MDTQCKVFFPVDSTEEQAKALLVKYVKNVKIDTFMSNREVGCNVVTYAIVTLPFEVAQKLVDDRIVSRIDTITTFRGSKSCCEEAGDCGPGG